MRTLNTINANQNYTHTVFLGIASAQVCGPCHNWSTNVYNTYVSGDYEIIVKAKDTFGTESNWSESLSIHIVEPIIKIGNITGGLFRVNVVIKNVGDGVATNVDWNINLTGGWIIWGDQSTGLIPSIPPGGEIVISSKIILGLGRTNILVDARIKEGTSDTKNVDALLLGIYILI